MSSDRAIVGMRKIAEIRAYESMVQIRPGAHGRLGSLRIFPLEDDMSTFSQSRTLVACMGAALLGGVSALAMMAGNVVTIADAGTAITDGSPSVAEQDFPICHTPTAGRAP